MSKFKIGDRVKHVEYGKGIIINISGDLSTYAIKFDNSLWFFHNCGGLCEYGRGYFTLESELEKIKFTRADLEDGDILTTKSGAKLRLNDDDSLYWLGEIETEYLSDIDALDENLKMVDRDYKEDDILKVERPVKFETVFEREEEKTEMTIAEIEEKLGYEIKIIKEEN